MYINWRGLLIFFAIWYYRVRYCLSRVLFEVEGNFVKIYRYDRKYKNHKFKIEYPLRRMRLHLD